MTKRLPNGGLPMWPAMAHLYEGTERDLLLQFDQLETFLKGDVLKHQARAVWSGIIRRYQHNEVLITAVASEKLNEEPFPKRLVQLAFPDRQRNLLNTEEGSYRSVLVHSVKPEETASGRQNSAEAPSSPKSFRRDFRQVDIPLLQEMQLRIEGGEARGVNDAARAVTGKAEGDGSPESKTKRLTRHYPWWKKQQLGSE